jgi:hypothetical protein
MLKGIIIRPTAYNSTCIEHPFVKCYYYDIMRTNMKDNLNIRINEDIQGNVEDTKDVIESRKSKDR